VHRLSPAQPTPRLCQPTNLHSSAHHLERIRYRLREDTRESTNAEICQRRRARTTAVGCDRDQGGAQVSPREKRGACVRYDARQADCEATIELEEREGMEEVAVYRCCGCRCRCG
jgi:hypothetical protein